MYPDVPLAPRPCYMGLLNSRKKIMMEAGTDKARKRVA
jgi:hypothetical protein